MSGLELLGMFFCILLGMGVFLIVIWVIGSTWRHGDEINVLNKEVASLKTKLYFVDAPKTKRRTR